MPWQQLQSGFCPGKGLPPWLVVVLGLLAGGDVQEERDVLHCCQHRFC